MMFLQAVELVGAALALLIAAGLVGLAIIVLVSVGMAIFDEALEAFGLRRRR